MFHQSKIKLAALVGITLSVFSLLVHIFVANYSMGDSLRYKLQEDYLYPQGHSILPSSLDEYQRLRCRVAFHALKFRSEIQALGKQMVERLQATGGQYLSYHPGLVKNTLAFHGCAELFQSAS